MNKADAILDLDYDSPLENLFWFLGSPWCMGGTTLATWFLMVSPGKNGTPPIWADFPIGPFSLIMLFVWAVGFWLKANYDVRYQLDSSTQQLNLVRKIFGQVFKSRVADFSQLDTVAIMSSWADQKSGARIWSYALCLVTKSARMVRVSSWASVPQSLEASQVADNLGIKNFPCQSEVGSLKAKRGREGEVNLSYHRPLKDTALSPLTIVFVVLVVIAVIVVFCIGLSR